MAEEDRANPHQLLRLAGTWQYGVIIAVLAFAAGLMGSIFSEPIRSAFPICCWPFMDSYRPGQMRFAGSHVVIFWTAALLWFALFTLRQVAESRAVREAKQHAGALKESVDNTRTAAQTIRDNLSEARSSLESAVGQTRQDLGGLVTEAKADIRSGLDTATTELRRSVEDAKGRVSESIDRAEQHAATLSAAVTGSALTLQDAVSRTQTVLQQIHTSVQTLPPRNYLNLLADFTVLAHRLVVQPDKAAARVRHLLRLIVRLAEAYDGRSGVRYASNVMRFRPSTDKEFLEAVLALDVPLPKGFTWDDLSGVLVLDMDLTASLDGRDERDGRVVEVAFGIPQDTTAGRGLLLPGAPTAFALEQDGRSVAAPVYATGDLQQMPAELQASGAFDEATIARLQELFGPGGEQGEWVRSGLSFPLYEIISGQPYAERASGVLNLHCNLASALAESPLDSASHRAFAVTIQHFVEMIAALLWPPRDPDRREAIGSR